MRAGKPRLVFIFESGQSTPRIKKAIPGNADGGFARRKKVDFERLCYPGWRENERSNPLRKSNPFFIARKHRRNGEHGNLVWANDLLACGRRAERRTRALTRYHAGFGRDLADLCR